MKRKKAPPVFKEYTMGQLILLPTNLEELIAPHHLVRMVNAFVERMDLAPLLSKYKGGGTSSYHPKMLLKVFMYAYTQKIFSSRRIAKALRESIPFMWLSGNQRPDFRTINRFRGELLKGIIEEVFLAVLSLLIEGGYVKLEDYFVDGTKLEANANRYTYVWAKSTQRYQMQLVAKVAALFAEIERVNAEENARYGDRDLEEVGEDGPIDPHQLEQQVAELNAHLQDATQAPAPAEPEPPAEPRLSQVLESKLQEVQQALAENPDHKPLKQAAKQLEEDYLPRARKYEDQQRNLAGRNSYSKTDPDATFMRLKDDHLGTGQLKAAYNVQLGTENQFVVGFSLHQEAGDTNCLIPHLKGVKRSLGRLPQKANGDAAYGSEENYAYLEQERVDNYLKFAGFDREQKKRYQPDPFQAEHMPYDPERDQFTCPNGKHLRYRWTEHRKTKNGYLTERRIYACESCVDCPLKAKCTRASGNRQVRVSFQLWAYRQQARENLRSEEGQRLRSQRGVDVESVFGRVKEDWGFRRFLLRGLAKVTIEWGLLSIAHNLAKVWSVENGLTTTEIPLEGRQAGTFEVALDFQAHKVSILTSWGAFWDRLLEGQPVQDFHSQVLAALAGLGIQPELDPSLFADPEPRSYDARAVETYWQTLCSVDSAFKRFKAELPGETSPVQLWPHHFDLALMWLPGTSVPGVDPADEENADKQMAFGFSSGDEGIPDPYFYITVYPWPAALADKPLPAGAAWHTSGWNGALLMYKYLTQTDAPQEKLLEFLRSGYQAGSGFLA